MAVQLIIDSASDIQPREAQAMGLVCLPLIVRFGDREYADSVDLSHREFYEKLIESDILPTTSQISPAVFQDAYDRVEEQGDTAVVITLSGQLSGTYQSAVIAAQGREDRICVVDSENVTIGERLLILRGVALRDGGLSAGEIAQKLNEEKGQIRLMALLDTLEYLKKGGRVSSAVAFAGGLLSIKPVVAVEHGQVAMAGKARGSKQGNNLLRTMIDQCGGIDFDRPFALAYTGLSDQLLRKYIADSADLWQDRTHDLPISSVGAAIGTHVGPGAVAVAFFEKR